MVPTAQGRGRQRLAGITATRRATRIQQVEHLALEACAGKPLILRGIIERDDATFGIALKDAGVDVGLPRDRRRVAERLRDGP